VFVIVGVDTASGEDRDMNAPLEAAVSQVEGTDNVVSNSLLPVILAPVDVWSSSRTSSIQDVCWLNFLQLGDDSFSVLHANRRGVDFLSYTIVSFEVNFGGQNADLGSQGASSSGQQPSPRHPRSGKHSWRPWCLVSRSVCFDVLLIAQKTSVGVGVVEESKGCRFIMQGTRRASQLRM
jgi:hypothetical protein